MSDLLSPLRMGWRGTVTAVMLVVAAGLHVGVVQPLELQAEQEALALEVQLAQSMPHTSHADAGQAQWAALLASLPQSQGLQLRAGELLRLTTSHGLVSVGDVVIDSLEGGPGQVVRWRVRQEIKGRYASLREMLASALRQDAALSLNVLRIMRDGAEAAEVQAELQWSLYARHAVETSP